MTLRDGLDPSWPKRRSGAPFLASVIVLLLGFHAQCAAAQPRQPSHVACVGDSITAGTGASSSATNYPADLQGLFGSTVQVKNFGHSGATLLSTGDRPYTQQAEYTSANTFVSGAGSSAVVDVIIMLGTNDSKPANWNTTGGGTQAQQLATDCAALVDHFRGLSTHPVVYLALPLTAYSNTFTISGTVIKDEIIPVLQQVAQQKGVPTIDLNTPTAAHAAYFTDGVHPNDGGYKIVAQTMHDGLLRVPQVSLSAPLAGSSIAGSVVNLIADASGGNVPITSVAFLSGSIAIGTATQAPFSASWANVAPGSYALSAKATDATGAAATSAAVQISVVAGDNGGASSNGGASGNGGVSGNGGTAGAEVGVGGAGAPGSGAGGAAAGGAGAATMSAAGMLGAAGSGLAGAGVVGASAGSASQPATDGASESSGSCGCRVAPSRALSLPPLVAYLLLLGFGLRRSRRQS